MARTRPCFPRLSEVDKIQPQHTRAVKQPGIGRQFGRPSVGGKTPAHRHYYTGTAPGGLGKSFYPRPNPSRRSRRKRRLTLPPLKGPKPHNRVPHEIRHYQNTTNLLIQKATFQDFIRYIAYNVTQSTEAKSTYWDRINVRFTPQALQAIQEAAEYYLIKMFINSCQITAAAKRKTCFPVDLRIGVKMGD